MTQTSKLHALLCAALLLVLPPACGEDSPDRPDSDAATTQQDQGTSEDGGVTPDTAATPDTGVQPDQQVVALDKGAPQISYSKKIQPILNSRCKKCHGPTKAAGKYRMDTYQLTMKPGVTGKKPVTPYAAAKSLAWSIEEGAKGTCGLCWHNYFTKAERAAFKTWINQGAKNN